MDIKYPIGRAEIPDIITAEHIQGWIEKVERAPRQLREAVRGLSEEQLNTPYREGGWTVRQVIHHLADTHVNTYLNFRHALTEDDAKMRATKINDWAALPDSLQGDVEPSLDLFTAVQMRWAMLLKGMSSSQFERAIVHPSGDQRTLARLLAVYAWHAEHHTAHIAALRKRKAWQ